VLVVGNDGQFEKFCSVIGRPELATEERFARNSGRVKNRHALAAIINERLLEHGMAHWLAAFDAAGVPAGPINTVPMVFQDEQVRHRGMLVDAPHPLSGRVPLVASPMKFTVNPLSAPTAPPLLGEHTESVLREIGWS
jgi:crotonobetainyl-CoA:carnitine CoA-transferase CaiB-like acyl-CoA transferase